MALFGLGGGSIPSINTGALNAINEENKKRRNALIQGLNPSLAPISKNYEQKQTALGESIMPNVQKNLDSLGKDLSGINTLEKQNAITQGAKAREQAFRNVPELQSAIRESLGAQGLTGNSRAASAIADPYLEANRQASDLENTLTAQANQSEIARKESFAKTGFGSRAEALNQKFGLDEQTINYLTSIGRQDLIDEASKLIGSEDQYGANQLAIEESKQANDIARAQAANAQRANIIGGLGQLGGAAIGFGVGGPLGASLGAQLGGSAANIATGSPTTFDPSLLYLLNQRNKTAVK